MRCGHVIVVIIQMLSDRQRCLTTTTPPDNQPTAHVTMMTRLQSNRVDVLATASMKTVR